MPYEILNYINAFIIALIGVIVSVLVLAKWKKTGIIKIAVTALVLSVVNDIGYIIFSYLISVNLSNQQKATLIYSNLGLTILFLGLVCMAMGRKYLRINANSSVIFAVVYIALYFFLGIFLAPVLLGLFAATGLFKL